MLAVGAQSEAEMLTLIVTDHGSFPSPPSRFTVTLPTDATLQMMHEKCAETAGYVPGTVRAAADRRECVPWPRARRRAVVRRQWPLNPRPRAWRRPLRLVTS